MVASSDYSPKRKGSGHGDPLEGALQQIKRALKLECSKYVSTMSPGRREKLLKMSRSYRKRMLETGKRVKRLKPPPKPEPETSCACGDDGCDHGW
jgi:hypothetical protein